jgi:hypothetical protein
MAGWSGLWLEAGRRRCSAKLCEGVQKQLIPDRYDVAVLAQGPIRAEAMADMTLLGQVVRHKETFYPSGWAHRAPRKFPDHAGDGTPDGVGDRLPLFESTLARQ